MKPADPTRVELAFHSDGRFEVTRTKPDGMKLTETYAGSSAGLLMVLTANPGGDGMLDANGAHVIHLNGTGAYFRLMLERIY